MGDLLSLPKEVSDAELIRRVRCAYGRVKANALEAELAALLEAGEAEQAEELRATYTYRRSVLDSTTTRCIEPVSTR